MRKVYDDGLATGTGKSTILPRFNSVIESHEQVASKFFGVAVEDVTTAQRLYIKRLRFAAIYGSDYLLRDKKYEEVHTFQQDFSSQEARVLALGTYDKMYQSNAKWPEGTLSGVDNDISSDIHSTEDEANGVCSMLETDGFGGEGKIFPTQTWICFKVAK